MMNVKKLITGILLVSMLSTVFQVDMAKASTKKLYSDVAGHKYETALLYVTDNGLMTNKGDKIFPDSALTKGAACLVLNNLLGATERYDEMDKVGNLKPDDKYYATVSIGLNCGYLKQKTNNDIYNPLAKATYGYLADIFSNMLGINMKEEVIGEHDPKDVLTRGEYAILLQKLAPNILSKDTTSKVSSGDVYITKANITVSNMTVDGNLIITDVVGDEDVTLRNVIVNGKLIVRGGGENSINISGSSKISEVVIQQVNHNVSLKVQGNTIVGDVRVNKNSSGVNIYGKVETLTVETASPISLNEAEVSKVILTVKRTSLSISKNAKVESMVVEESAEGSLIEVAGTVSEIFVSAKDSGIKIHENGKVSGIKVEKNATNLSVYVSKDAIIEKVESEADNTSINGEGSVEESKLTGMGSEDASTGDKITQTVSPTPTMSPTATPTPTTRPTATPIPNPDLVEGKYQKKDYNAITAIIAQQKALGATVSEDLEDKQQYTWNDEGRLIGLNWSFKNLQGSMDLNELSNLASLICVNNKLSKLEVSQLTNLTELNCYINQIMELDVSQLINLEVLSCGINQLTELDVSKLIKLKYLGCCVNQLKKLDVSQLTNLTELVCYGNQLTKLDVSRLIKLEFSDCSANQITELDVSRLTKLTYLDCSYNQLSELNVSQLIILTYLSCSGNKITELDVSNLSFLETLYWDSPSPEDIPASESSEVEYNVISSSFIPKIDELIIFPSGHDFVIEKVNIAQYNAITEQIETVRLYTEFEPLSEGVYSLQIMGKVDNEADFMLFLRNVKIESEYSQIDISNCEIYKIDLYVENSSPYVLHDYFELWLTPKDHFEYFYYILTIVKNEPLQSHYSIYLFDLYDGYDTAIRLFTDTECLYYDRIDMTKSDNGSIHIEMTDDNLRAILLNPAPEQTLTVSPATDPELLEEQLVELEG